MSARIEDLEPVTRSRCEAFMRACTAVGISVRITHTLRSMDEQAHLYMQGRSLPGRIVTNAKPGASAHNFGMAFDFCFAGKVLAECYPPESDPRWEQVGKIGEGLDLVWGGRWKSITDRPHFERPDWKVVSGRLA